MPALFSIGFSTGTTQDGSSVYYCWSTFETEAIFCYHLIYAWHPADVGQGNCRMGQDWIQCAPRLWQMVDTKTFFSSSKAQSALVARSTNACLKAQCCMSLTLSAAQAATATHHGQVFTGPISYLNHYCPATAMICLLKDVYHAFIAGCFHCWMKRTLATPSRLAVYMHGCNSTTLPYIA